MNYHFVEIAKVKLDELEDEKIYRIIDDCNYMTGKQIKQEKELMDGTEEIYLPVSDKETKVEQIAQNYHDRPCMSGLTMDGQVCKCCENVVRTTTSIEHDSQDHSKDLKVCTDCYIDIATWWKNNKPGKIAPL